MNGITAYISFLINYYYQYEKLPLWEFRWMAAFFLSVNIVESMKKKKKQKSKRKWNIEKKKRKKWKKTYCCSHSVIAASDRWIDCQVWLNWFSFEKNQFYVNWTDAMSQYGINFDGMDE